MKAADFNYENCRNYVYKRRQRPLRLPDVRTVTFSNGTRCHIIPTTKIEITRVDWLFRTIDTSSGNPLTASFTAKCMLEGCEGMDSKTLAKEIERHGAEIGLDTTSSGTIFSVVSTPANISGTFAPIWAMFTTPTFPEKELNILKNNEIENQAYYNQRVSARASRRLRCDIFGEEHTYAVADPIRYTREISSDMLREFHKNNFGSSTCEIVVSGCIDDAVIARLEEVFGQTAWGPVSRDIAPSEPSKPSADLMVRLHQEGVMQSAIAMGFETITQDHKDFDMLKMLILILGGCQSSRLNHTVREINGMTYNISAHITSLRDKSYISIHTQTSAPADDVINLIKSEIDRLVNEPITDKEMELIRNLTRGKLTRMFSSPLGVANTYASLLYRGRDFGHYLSYMRLINKVTPADLQATARKYLTTPLHTVVIEKA